MKFLSLHINSAKYGFLTETLKYEKKNRKKKRKRIIADGCNLHIHIIKIAYRNIQVNMLHVASAV